MLSRAARWRSIAAAGVVLIAALTAWGINAHRGSPRWVPGETFTRTQAKALLRGSVADLHGAALLVHLAGTTSADLEGAVSWAQPTTRAALRVTAGGVPQQTVVRIIGKRAWARADPKAAWARTELDPTPSTQAQVLLSDVAGGVDLHAFFAGTDLGVRSMEHKGQVVLDGVAGDGFTFTIATRAARRLLPGLVAADPSVARVPVKMLLDQQARLRGFQVAVAGQSVVVLITARNPKVVVQAPHGPTVPLKRIVGVAYRNPAPKSSGSRP